ncbi:hypothetical protein V4C53_30130 [Paraburkholderia azotifigens]|uniref:hypothetical protein n=1 Tax=Paraburkholderia azotifigens TaxID=2057004 RepID=UPI003177038B
MEFDSFGVRYRMKQMAAADAFRVFINAQDLGPLDMMRDVSVKTDSGWVELFDESNLNTFVRDNKHIVQPREVLNGLISVVSEFNWGFLKHRQQLKVPSYLRGNSEVKSVEGIDPVMGTLIAAGKATLIELETHYSLEDAFKIYDILCNDQINKAQAQYDAVQAAKSKAK